MKDRKRNIRISDFIPFGRENRITRARLAALSGISDREIRDMIKRENKRLANDEEPLIVSSSGTSGYWRTDDIEEIMRHCREEERRARSIMRNIAPFRQQLNDGQALTHVMAHYRKKPGQVAGQMKMEN